MESTAGGRRYKLLILATALIASPASAAEEAAPTGAHQSGRTTDTGYTNLVNATGGLSQSVPLMFPPSRRGLGVPVQVVYGGKRMGAAGLGWDVPLSYVLRDMTIHRRLPDRASHTNALVPRARLGLVL